MRVPTIIAAGLLSSSMALPAFAASLPPNVWESWMSRGAIVGPDGAAINAPIIIFNPRFGAVGGAMGTTVTQDAFHGAVYNTIIANTFCYHSDGTPCPGAGNNNLSFSLSSVNPVGYTLRVALNPGNMATVKSGTLVPFDTTLSVETGPDNTQRPILAGGIVAP